MKDLQELWDQLEGAVSAEQQIHALNLCLYLIVAGALGLLVRQLYRRCASTPSDTDSISRVFPLLAIVVTAVIAVVKSSLALSLGLVGALSIVRFRAAIKDPEELVFLFLCIAIGLALGAEQPLLAVSLAAVSTATIVGTHLVNHGRRQHRLLLTITGDSSKHFTNDPAGVLPVVSAVAGSYTLQRYDVENGRGQVRIVLNESKAQRTSEVIVELQRRLPECDLSYVNLNSTL